MPAVRPRFHLTPCSKFRSHLKSRSRDASTMSTNLGAQDHRQRTCELINEHGFPTIDKLYLPTVSGRRLVGRGPALRQDGPRRARRYPGQRRRGNRVACAKEILDRGYGRPIQAVDMVLISKKLSELSTQELLELNSRLVSSGAVGAQPPAEEAIH
jgi:hypothetical protein